MKLFLVLTILVNSCFFEKLASLDTESIKINSIANKERKKEIIRFIQYAMKETGTPGLSIAIIEKGKVVFIKGFGELKLNGKEKVTPNTLFMIGSIAKSMTSMMIGTLIDDGKFEWDTKIKNIYPQFKVGDDKLSEKLEIQHLMNTTSGIPKKDIAILFNKYKKPEDLFVEISKMKPTSKLGEKYQYQNQLFASAGYIASRFIFPKKEMNEGYSQLMKEKIFNKIGMKNTVTSIIEAQKLEHAFPHSHRFGGKIELMPMNSEDFIEYIGPAGNVWSSVRDIAEYIRVELNNGKNNTNEQIISERNIKYRRKPQIKISDYEEEYYGVGLAINFSLSTNKDQFELIMHGGETNGFTSVFCFVPEKKLGLVILTNKSENDSLCEAVLRKLFELWTGLDLKAEKGFIDKVRKKNQEYKIEAIEYSGKAFEEIEKILGTHKNDEIGEVFLTKKDRNYYINNKNKNSKLAYLKNTKKILLDDGEKKLELIPANGSFKLKINEKDSDSEEEYVFVRSIIS